ncbi:alpha-1B adrenergic receptor [Trichonephila clavata]|uniref:Alpha-1B adrenergic receptor n=1 Tax=Trichonephila clavata TaxID=2740835 RepID=A0A8X6KNP4_TRICU|nr:alpha-1B adrenergic receptor [Trichonephila clavata]
MAPTTELEEISLPLGNKISDIAIIIINLTETEEAPWNISDWANSSLSQNMSGLESFGVVIKGTILTAIILLTIFGNTLVLLAVSFTPNLRSTTNIFIVNLAIADLLLGVFVLPFSAFLEMNNKQWIFGYTFCNVWAALDVLCCTASIISLCFISVDRYVGVTRPLAYSNIVTHSRAVIACFAIWFVSTAISVGPLLGWKEPPPANPYVCEVTKQLGYVLFSVTFSFYLPCIIIFIVYFRIYKAAVKQTKFLETGVKVVKSAGHETTKELTLRVHAGAHHVLSPAARNGTYGDKTSIKVTMANLQGRLAKFRRQKKAAKTLGIVVGVFILCWFPFFLILPLGKLGLEETIANIFIAKKIEEYNILD